MVDLHDSLRPSGAAPPLPVSEIAARGKRRKRRRTISTAGVAVATLSIAAIAISSLPGSSAETVTVADDSTDEPSDQTTALPTTIADTIGTDTTTTTATTTTADSADTDTDSIATGTDDTETTTSIESLTSLSDEGIKNHPLTTPGIRSSATITSQWEDGYCMQIEVINDNIDRDSWQVGLDLDGTIATLWNATVVEASQGTFVFSGLEDYNVTIQAGAVTSFGACVDTDPS